MREKSTFLRNTKTHSVFVCMCETNSLLFMQLTVQFTCFYYIYWSYTYHCLIQTCYKWRSFWSLKNEFADFLELITTYMYWCLYTSVCYWLALARSYIQEVVGKGVSQYLCDNHPFVGDVLQRKEFYFFSSNNYLFLGCFTAKRDVCKAIVLFFLAATYNN